MNKKIASELRAGAQLLITALKNDNKVFVCGNGGSAAQAQYFAAELTSCFETERDALPALSLTTDTSALTAGANDYGYETVFERQVAALAQPGDVLVGLTTSGSARTCSTHSKPPRRTARRPCARSEKAAEK